MELVRHEPKVPLEVLAEQEHEQRRRLRRLELAPARSSAPIPSPEDALVLSANVLELHLALATLSEAVNRLGVVTVADAIRSYEPIVGLATTLAKLDIQAVLTRNEPILRPALKPPQNDQVAGVPMGLVTRTIEAFLINCPMDVLAKLGETIGRPDLVHQCRIAYDGLRAFLARNNRPGESALFAVGHAYAEGRLSLEEVAAILDFTTTDAVAVLEEHGFRRDVERLRLTDEERRQRMARIRADRAERAGEPQLSERQVARDVIASQRIEGIDARLWVRT